MTDHYIPYGRQSIDESDIEAVAEVLRSGWLTTGPMVEKFEKALVEKVGAKYAVVFNSGTAALHAAYYAAGIGQGDEIITTPITFAATANAALYMGAKPAFVDIGQDSFHLDPDRIEAAITSRTRAIVPVDMTGMPADLDAIMKIAKKHNLVVIEDACHALGATYQSKVVGSISDMTAFSFHPVKHITTGEGGAVTTDNETYCQRLVRFRNHGIERKPELFVNSCEETGALEIGPWYYEQQELGYNYRLSDINCALGLSQLNRLDQFLERRREIAAKYNEAFRNNPAILIPPEPFGKKSVDSSAWHLYILRLAGENSNRKTLLEKLHAKDIGTQVHYIPVYLHPYYRKLGYQPGLCSKAEDYYKRCFTIPLYPAMNYDDVARVIEAVNCETKTCL
jgi:perosamine synthetase